MRLILTTDDGEVLSEWSIGNIPEFDIEDLDAIPKHDFYLGNNYNDYKDVGEILWKEMQFYNEIERRPT